MILINFEKNNASVCLICLILYIHLNSVIEQEVECFLKVISITDFQWLSQHNASSLHVLLKQLVNSVTRTQTTLRILAFVKLKNTVETLHFNGMHVLLKFEIFFQYEKKTRYFSTSENLLE